MSTAKAKKTAVKIEASAPALQFIALKQIICEEQIRKEFDQESIEQLAADILQKGMLQPVLMRTMPDGKYMMIAGERRYRAAKFAGLESIPALVGEIDPERAYLMQLSENVHREELNFEEVCNAVATLYKHLGNMQAVADATKKSLSWCSKHYAMTQTDLHYKAKLLIEENITEDVELLNSFSTFCTMTSWHEIQELYEKIQEGRAGRSEVREAVKELKAQQKKEKQEEAAENKVSHAKQKTPPAPPVWTIDEAIEDLSRAICYTDNESSAKQLLATYTKEQIQQINNKLFEAVSIGNSAEGFKTITTLIRDGIYSSPYSDIELMAMIWGQSKKEIDTDQFWEAIQCPREQDPE